MLTRTLAASVPPKSGRLRDVLPSWRTLVLRLGQARQHSLLIQDRVDAARARCIERYGGGRR